MSEVTTDPGPPVVVAVALLVDAGRLLLVHRRADREHVPDCWDLPGGHVEPGETPEQALRRECREELGIEIGACELVLTQCPIPGLRKHVFRVRSWSGEPRNAAPDEHDDLRWCTPGDAARLRLADPPGLVTVLGDAVGD